MSAINDLNRFFELCLVLEYERNLSGDFFKTLMAQPMLYSFQEPRNEMLRAVLPTSLYHNPRRLYSYESTLSVL
jgi:hypothetical protein